MNSLEPIISEALIKCRYEKMHKHYVDNLNKILIEVDDALAEYKKINNL